MVTKPKKSTLNARPELAAEDVVVPDAEIDSMVRPTADIEGAINRHAGLHGWVWDKSKPYHALTVELYANNMLVAQAVADRFEMDLAEREIGNGKHAFSLLATSWPDMPLPVDLEVRIDGTPHVLGKFQVGSPSDIADFAETAPLGHVDGLIDGELRGWACDRAKPSMPASVDLCADGAVLLTVFCSEFRQDLKAAGYAGGHGGFAFPLPLVLLDGKTHSLSVCYSGTQHPLPNGTMLFGLTKESELTKYIADMVKTVKQIQTELGTVEQRLLARHEALLTIQRENMERELQVLRKLLIVSAEQQNVSSVPILESPSLAKTTDEKLVPLTRRSPRKVA